MFSRLTQRLVPFVPRQARSRVAKAAFGGLTVVGLCSATEVQVQAAGENAPEPDSKIPMQWLIGGAVLIVAGVGYFMLQADDSKKNVAFIFVKPHAFTDGTIELVRSELQARGITIKTEGCILGTTIDEKKYIDQHYYSIASKATLLSPKDLPVPADKFQAQFGLRWEDALNQGIVYNAMEACNKFGISADELDAKWAIAKKTGKLVKFGGGFYCAEVDGLYIFNGFFMSMRSKFTGDAKIHYFVGEWNADDLSWADFRGKVLGPTDPEGAPADSIRGMVAAQWRQLGLPAPCNVGDNAVHASASPF